MLLIPVSQLVALLVIRPSGEALQCWCSGNRFYFIVAPKPKGSDAGSLHVPKRSHKMFPWSKKVKILDLPRKKENHVLRLLRSRTRTNLQSMKFVKKEREIHASFLRKILLYCCILLLVIIVNLLPCLIPKLNSSISMCV